MKDQPVAERALEEDVLRVSSEFHTGEGGKSPMLEVQIVSIAGDVFTLPVSRDDTVRNHCRQQQQQQDMNGCVPGSGAGAARKGGDGG